MNALSGIWNAGSLAYDLRPTVGRPAELHVWRLKPPLRHKNASLAHEVAAVRRAGRRPSDRTAMRPCSTRPSVGRARRSAAALLALLALGIGHVAAAVETGLHSHTAHRPEARRWKRVDSTRTKDGPAAQAWHDRGRLLASGRPLKSTKNHRRHTSLHVRPSKALSGWPSPDVSRVGGRGGDLTTAFRRPSADVTAAGSCGSAGTSAPVRRLIKARAVAKRGGH